MTTEDLTGPHRISLPQAIDMTTRFRQNRTSILLPQYAGADILARCETFDKSAFDWFLSNTDCVSIRIYYGMSPNLQVHAIIVGADSNGNDLLPDDGTIRLKEAVAAADDDEPPILEDGARCPIECPPDSPLNQP